MNYQFADCIYKSKNNTQQDQKNELAMVLLTSIIITVILYYLQASGLIYVTIIAVVAELINLFMTQTMTKTVEAKAARTYGKTINTYKVKIAHQSKNITELKKIRDDSVHKLYKANQTIKKYEEELGIEDSETIEIPGKQDLNPKAPAKKEVEVKDSPNEEFTDLPAGSNRKDLPI